MKKIVHLCKDCIEDLKEYNPYIVPISIVEVPVEECDNYEDNLGNTDWGWEKGDGE